MVTRYGMSEQFGMVALETVNNAYLGGDASLWPVLRKLHQELTMK